MLGPGSVDHTRTVNEFVETAELRAAVSAYRALAERLLSAAGT